MKCKYAFFSGLPAFNFSINRNKVLTNFSCNVAGLEDIPVLDDTGRRTCIICL